MGCYYDVWLFGVIDFNSGMVMLFNLVDVLGVLVKVGYCFKCIIKIVYWDVEEFGILGLMEWVEEFKDEFSKNVIVYFNVDGVCIGLIFGGFVSFFFKLFMIEVIKVVEYFKENCIIYEYWFVCINIFEKGLNIGNLGGGFDYFFFYVYLGILSLSVGM